MPVVGLDRDLALSRVGGDLDLLKEIAAIFLEDLPRSVAKIEESISTKDFELLERSAHGLKGAASNFGASDVVEFALNLEKMGREKNLSGAEEGLRTLRSALATLKAELEAFQNS